MGDGGAAALNAGAKWKALEEFLRRRATAVVSAGAIAAFLGSSVAAMLEADSAARWIAARQLLGLAAFGFLAAAVLIGPLTFVAPRMPLRSFLIAGRRAAGVSAFALAIAHSTCYLGPALFISWRRIFSPGLSWVFGLSLGLAAFLVLAALAATSRDAAVRSMGGRRWKRFHRLAYFAVIAVFLHALGTGSDFGVNRPPDVHASADFGALIAFSVLVALWILFAVLRRRKIRIGARRVDAR